MTDCLRTIESGETSLVRAIEKTLVFSCFIDYIKYVWNEHKPREDGKLWKPHEVSRDLDEHFGIGGTEYINHKFRLVCGLANGVKHRVLTNAVDLDNEYGSIGLSSLIEENNSVFFVADTHKFDYWKVVLRPICNALLNLELTSEQDVVDLVKLEVIDCGGFDYHDPDDPATTIDRMIDACNPECVSCGEAGDDCLCTEYLYKGQQGEFESDIDPNFDFDATMSQISGAYKKD